MFALQCGSQLHETKRLEMPSYTPTWNNERSCPAHFAVIRHIGAGIIVGVTCDVQSAGDDEDAIAVAYMVGL